MSLKTKSLLKEIDACQECAQAHINTLIPMENKNIHDNNFNMLSALKR
jgi:hypothetical protein